jgi:hypothetical protein
MSNRPAKAMKREYDFAAATRGKFYKAGAVLVPPIHLEPEIRDYLQARATAKGMTLNELVNKLLKRDIELIEAIG